MQLQRWQELMANLGFSENRQSYDDLVKAYAEKHRHYHNANHINAMLKHLDAASSLAERKAEIEIAIWFHDAIYRVFSTCSELKSACWAEKFLISNQAPTDMAQRVYSLIMATSHIDLASSNDEKLLVDIDLTIFGSRPEVFEQFEKNIRKEYKWIPSFIFNKKRAEIFSVILQSEKIYKHDYFYKKFEKQARENLSRTLKILEKK